MPTTLSAERLQGLGSAAAEAAVAALPAPQGLLAGFAGDDTEPGEFLPGAGAVAVGARLRGGLSGQVALLLTPALAAALAAQGAGLAGVVEPALARAAAAFEPVAPAGVRTEGTAEVDAAGVLARADAAWAFVAVPLFADEDHQASLVVLVDDPDRAGDLDDRSPLAAVHDFPAVPGGAHPVAGAHALRLLHDVEMDVTVELGRTTMTVRQVLGLVPGSVVELDRAAGAPVDLFVNGTLIGRGEVVVIDEEYGVRISEIVDPSESGD